MIETVHEIIGGSIFIIYIFNVFFGWSLNNLYIVYIIIT